MSTIIRTLRNLRQIGIKEYAHQMQYIGDTKAGTYIATDKYGNKYYENQADELPRTPFPPSFSLPPLLFPSSLSPNWPLLPLPIPPNKSPSLTPHNSPHPLGRLRPKRIRSLTNRTGLARLDVVYGRQTTHRGRGAENGPEEVGDTGA